MNGYLIALIVFLAWVALVYVLHRVKFFEKHGMSLTGPIIMWKTKRGKAFIDRLASRQRFWTTYATLSLWICAGAMVTIMVLLLWEATIVPQLSRPPSPELILGIPGINPVIPIGYGILALVVAIVFHEFAHGIMTRLGGMQVQSMGVLFLVFPIGAFVEPDDKELQTTTRRKRSRVYAAGPATNIILALITLGLFSGVMMSSVEPAHEGVIAVGVVEDSPASIAGIRPSSVITGVAGTTITSTESLDSRVSPEPGALIQIQYYYKGELKTVSNVTDGVVIGYAAQGFAAYEANLKVGMVLASLNDTPIGNVKALESVMALCKANQVVNLTVMSYDSLIQRFIVNSSIRTITLSDKYEYYKTYDPGNNDESYKHVAYLGGGFLNLGIDDRNSTYYSSTLAHPFRGDRNIGDISTSWLRLIALPFLDLAPLRSPVTDLYEPSGALAWMPAPVFWLITNSLYWIFWLNLMVGLTNVLPAVPLDGGYIFRDGLDYLLSKTKKSYTMEQKDRIVSAVTMSLALLVLGLILWQLVGPAF